MKNTLTAHGILTLMLSAMITLIGGIDELINMLILMIIVDIITGIIKAVIKKDVSSKVMFYGIIKKMLIFLVVMIAVEADRVIASFGVSPIKIGDYDLYIRTIAIVYYLLEEFVSMCENLIQIGVPFPGWVVKIFRQISDTVNTDNVDDASDFIKKLLSLKFDDLKLNNKDKNKENNSNVNSK